MSEACLTVTKNTRKLWRHLWPLQPLQIVKIALRVVLQVAVDLTIVPRVFVLLCRAFKVVLEALVVLPLLRETPLRVNQRTTIRLPETSLLLVKLSLPGNYLLLLSFATELREHLRILIALFVLEFSAVTKILLSVIWRAIIIVTRPPHLNLRHVVIVTKDLFPIIRSVFTTIVVLITSAIIDVSVPATSKKSYSSGFFLSRIFFSCFLQKVQFVSPVFLFFFSLQKGSNVFSICFVNKKRLIFNNSFLILKKNKEELTDLWINVKNE